MGIGRFIQQLGYRTGAPRKGPVVSICGWDEFATLVQREHNRSERSGEPFFVVEFHVGDPVANKAMAEELLRVLARRLRTTDEVGWSSKTSIGAILVGATHIDAATSVAESILENMECAVKPSYSLHSSFDKSDIKGDEESAEEDPEPEPGMVSFRLARRAPKTKAVTELKLMSRRAMPPWKRVVDLVFSSIMLALLSPLLVAVALYIKVASPGPVFFRQERVGYGGKVFVLFKFRTMHHNIDPKIHEDYVKSLIKNADSDDESDDKPMVKLDKGRDPRVIPCGDILRKTAIDELPQFFNVIRGEMSVVGPRPPIPYEVEEYVRWHTGRFDTVPGLTGLWQVSGKNKLTFRQMARLDIRYARQMSFWLDLRIIAMTPAAIIRQALGIERIDTNSVVKEKV